MIYYYYINPRLSVIFCPYSGDVYLSLIISSSFASGLFFCAVFETLLILSKILFPIKSQAASSVFSIALFEVALSEFLIECLA